MGCSLMSLVPLIVCSSFHPSVALLHRVKLCVLRVSLVVLLLIVVVRFVLLVHPVAMLLFLVLCRVCRVLLVFGLCHHLILLCVVHV